MSRSPSAPQCAIPPARPHFSPESQERLHARLDAILNGWLSRGPLAEEFERRFAEYVGAKHGIAMSSGSAALLAALSYFDLRGGEVVIPTMTCFSCAGAVILAGGVPRLVNVDPDTMCIDFQDTVANVEPQTRGILIVHLAGQIVPDIDKFRALCRERSLFLLEDAAHATGASVHGRNAGSLADVACFSFRPTKIITTGEGGMVTTHDDELADFCVRFRDGGRSRDGDTYSMAGLNTTMDELSAALGLEQLAELDGFVLRRNEIVERYRRLLREIPGVDLLPLSEGSRSSYWKVYARLPAEIDRDALARRMLEEHGIDVRPAYRPLLHRQPGLARYVSDPSRLAPSERAMSSLVCLPIFLTISEEAMERAVDALGRCLQEA